MTLLSDPRPTMDDRWLCGWRVASALPLPELLPWTGDDRAPDLTIDFGRVPERQEGPAAALPWLQVESGGACRIAVRGVATYRIDPVGRRVTIDPDSGRSAADIRVFLLGTVFAALCYRRGLLPLHASCVRIGGRAVALAGASGMGKSTLAAALMRRDHAVLADDVTVLDTTAVGGPWVLPTFPRLRLRHDSLLRTGLPTDDADRGGPADGKYHLPIETGFCAQPLPLAAVFHLEPVGDRTDRRPRRLHGAEAAAWVGRDLHRNRMIPHLGEAHRVMPATATVARAPGGTWALRHGHDGGGLDLSVGTIEGWSGL